MSTPEEPYETYTDDDTTECPWCHAKSGEASSLGSDNCVDRGITECEKCGKDYHWELTVTYAYTCKPITQDQP